MEDGSVSMRQIVVPVDHAPRSDDAVERGLRALRGFGEDISKLTLLYVGDESHFPNVRVGSADLNVQRVCRKGTPAHEILAEAKETEADLLIMTSEGRHGFLDVLRGTITEQVLHGAMCPLLVVPADPFDS
jgi:nucleotide-binding universal stress UspA family protein